MRRAAGRFVVALGVGVLLGHSVQAAECTRTRYECALTYVEQQNFQAAIHGPHERLEKLENSFFDILIKHKINIKNLILLKELIIKVV